MIIALVKGTVFVGDGRILEKASVVVEGERILKVQKGAARLPKKARRVDMEGGTLLPGLIDAHVHLCADGSANPMAALVGQSLATTALKTAEFARRTLLAGVTTVRDMGGREYVDLAVRDAVKSGLIPGPRILASGRMICMTGGHGWSLGGREADGPDEVRRAVREQIKAGCDLIKLMATGGVLSPGMEAGAPQLTEEELRAGVEEAHKANRRTATHAQGRQGVLNALRAGIDSIEHGVDLDEEAISLMIKRGVALIPTLSAPFNMERRGVEDGVPEFALKKTARVKSIHLRSVQLARQLGVKVAMGTDAGTPFNQHGQNLNELRFMTEVGFSPEEALRAATQTGAQVLGLEEELGLIEAGKLADLVVVQGSPLNDITLLAQPERLCLIMQGGRMVKE